MLVVDIVPYANNDRFTGVQAILSSEKTVAKMRDMFDFDQSVFLAAFDPFIAQVSLP